jgi:hypothetical protein
MRVQFSGDGVHLFPCKVAAGARIAKVELETGEQQLHRLWAKDNASCRAMEIGFLIKARHIVAAILVALCRIYLLQTLSACSVDLCAVALGFRKDWRYPAWEVGVPL